MNGIDRMRASRKKALATVVVSSATQPVLARASRPSPSLCTGARFVNPRQRDAVAPALPAGASFGSTIEPARSGSACFADCVAVRTVGISLVAVSMAAKESERLRKRGSIEADLCHAPTWLLNVTLIPNCFL